MGLPQLAPQAEEGAVRGVTQGKAVQVDNHQVDPGLKALG